jgi:TRAP-type C4-dicarboxylate transport system permease small subunit
MSLRKVALWIARLIVLALALKFAWWAYQIYQPDGQAEPPTEVPDADKVCRVTPDTGQCFCRHRWTNERLSVPYRECVALAHRP